MHFITEHKFQHSYCISALFLDINTCCFLVNTLAIPQEALLMHWLQDDSLWQRICLGVEAVGLGTPL